MADFIIEEQMEKVINPKTKEYIKEVISSYYNGNYRASVVVLYTAVVYDLMQKVVTLKEIYNDNGAEAILAEIKEKQSKKPKNPEWEANLIENIYTRTKIISDVEKEELLYIKKQRNYAAHPIINFNDEQEALELKPITKETAIDLIRKAFEIVFLRDAILAKNIVNDVVFDLNEYYKRIGADGLNEYLNMKYYRRMVQSRKDVLFKALWKFVLIAENEECKKNREANFHGLVYLYNENKQHYQSLIKMNEEIYLGKLEVETIESWSGRSYKDITFVTISAFKKLSRVVYWIKFLEQFPEMYEVLNSQARNILHQSIYHMYTRDDEIEYSVELSAEQLKLKASAVFLSSDPLKHFEMILKQVTNCGSVLEEENLDAMFRQAEYRGCVNEFLEFLISYCTGAMSFKQACELFPHIIRYKKYFREEHYYRILARLNTNSQYYNNNYKQDFLNELKSMFYEKFHIELIREEEECYIYNKLYSFNNRKHDIKKLFALIEKRAECYSISMLKTLIFDLDKKEEIVEALHGQRISDYPNIIKVLDNKMDYEYQKCYIDSFKSFFAS